jgi:dihydropteroate synthase
VAARGVPAILMHTRGRPEDMYAHAIRRRRRRGDADLQRAIDAPSIRRGRERLIVDPGSAFAKRAEQSMDVWPARSFAALGCRCSSARRASRS